MPEVTDLPIWHECPWRASVPLGVEIRRGDANGVDMTVLWWPQAEKHVAAATDRWSEEGIEAAVRNLSTTI